MKLFYPIGAGEDRFIRLGPVNEQQAESIKHLGLLNPFHLMHISECVIDSIQFNISSDPGEEFIMKRA